jgi:hypothetical protein
MAVALAFILIRILPADIHRAESIYLHHLGESYLLFMQHGGERMA